MKKKMLLLFASIALLFALCACSKAEPVEHTIGEMKFSLPGDLELEEDADTAMQKMIDLDAYDDEDHFNEWVRELQYYYGNRFTLAISTSYVPYMDTDLDTFIADTYSTDGITEEGSEDIAITDAAGKIGHYVIEDAGATHYLYILKDGIFYEITMSLEKGDYPENYLEDIAASISFDAGLLKDQTIACGDIQFALPANYQSLSFEKTEDLYEESCLGWFGKTYMEVATGYFDMAEWSDWSSAELISSFMDAYGISEETRSTGEYPLGTYELASGLDPAGGTLELAMFEKDGKVYMITSYCEAAEKTQDINDIMQTVSPVE